MSLPQIGYTYLLIYFPIALAAPFVGFLNYKIRPSILISLGILGYALYSLGMIFVATNFLFYLLQILLGLAASLFFVSYRRILIETNPEKPVGSFGWFYSAPYYAAELAPIIGAILIWRFGFPGVFIISLLIHLANMAFTFLLKTKVETSERKTVKESFDNFTKIAKQTLNLPLLPLVTISFSVLLVGGFYQAFFVLFLKSIGWNQNTILIYGSIFSLLFLPLSLYGIRLLSQVTINRNIFRGGVLFAVVSVLFGIIGGSLGFMGILILMETGELGSFIVNAGRSGILSKSFSSYSKETAAVDTVFSPIGVAFGSMLGGLLIGITGFPILFSIGGVFVLGVSLIAKLKPTAD